MDSKQFSINIIKLLGYEIVKQATPFGIFVYTPKKRWRRSCISCGYDGMFGGNSIPNFMTDSYAMLVLDAELKLRGQELILTRGLNGTSAQYFDNKKRVSHGTYVANTEIEARALAAYKALKGKKWEGKGE